jgi:hypothetical protein
MVLNSAKLDAYAGRGPCPGSAVVTLVVQARHGLQRGVPASQAFVFEEVLLVQFLASTPFEQVEDLEPVRSHKWSYTRRQVDAVGPSKRLAEASYTRDARVDACVQRVEHPAHEDWVQERHVCRASKRHFATTDQGFQPRAETGEGPASFYEIVDDLAAAGEMGQALPSGPHDEDRTIHLACDDARHAAHQRGPMPFQERFWSTHP